MASPVIVLNLVTSTDRRAQIGARLDALGIAHRFLFGTRLSEEEMAKAAPPDALLFDRALARGEVGNAVSHLTAIAEIADGPDAFGCVMEDDAEILSPDFVRFLDTDVLRAGPSFDVLRLVSDPDRWKYPSWPVGDIAGHRVYALARPGWGTQAQIFSREGARKVAAQISKVTAPFDFVLFHDCHVKGLRVLEVRPGIVQHDMQHIHVDLQALSDIGGRAPPPRGRLLSGARGRRRRLRWRRKRMAMANFARVWGIGGLRRLLGWRPGSYFR